MAPVLFFILALQTGLSSLDPEERLVCLLEHLWRLKVDRQRDKSVKQEGWMHKLVIDAFIFLPYCLKQTLPVHIIINKHPNELVMQNTCI